jgi:hypothetical protein
MSSPSLPARSAALLLTAITVTACGASGPRTGALDRGTSNAHPTCRVHQHVLPSSDYTAGKDSVPLAVLTMLRYYTSQHALPFCDHKPPTAQDAAWTSLYNRLTGR